MLRLFWTMGGKEHGNGGGFLGRVAARLLHGSVSYLGDGKRSWTSTKGYSKWRLFRCRRASRSRKLTSQVRTVQGGAGRWLDGRLWARMPGRHQRQQPGRARAPTRAARFSEGATRSRVATTRTISQTARGVAELRGVGSHS